MPARNSDASIDYPMNSELATWDGFTLLQMKPNKKTKIKTEQRVYP